MIEFIEYRGYKGITRGSVLLVPDLKIDTVIDCDPRLVMAEAMLDRLDCQHVLPEKRVSFHTVKGVRCLVVHVADYYYIAGVGCGALTLEDCLRNFEDA